MPKMTQEELVVAIEQETTRIGLAFEALEAERAAGGLTKAQEDALQDRYEALVDRLKAIGTNPEQPISPEPLPA